MKRLSEQLAGLAVRVKNAEEAAAAAQKETHEKIAARREKARLAATAAIDKVNQDLKSTGDSVVRDWNAVKAKVGGDINALKAQAAQAGHERDAKRAEKRAERLEWEAAFAIDYALASIEQATLAALDAIDGRKMADEAKRAA